MMAAEVVKPITTTIETGLYLSARSETLCAGTCLGQDRPGMINRPNESAMALIASMK